MGPLEFTEVVSGFGTLEGPRIDVDGTLYFTDLFNGGVQRIAPDGTRDVLLPDRRHIGGIVLDESGGIVLGAQQLAFWDATSGDVRVLATELDGEPFVSVNDIEADAQGSVWAGTKDLPLPESPEERQAAAGMVRAANDGPWTRKPACLFRVDPDGTVTKLWEEGTVANGIGFSPDGGTLYMNDTVFGVFAYTLAADRTVRDRTHFARLPVEGLHNGLAVDAEGGVWVAASGGGSVVRFGPDGVVDEVIAVPAQSVMSLEFGGPDHQDLYVVCSDNQVDPGHAGTVFRARTEVPGLPGHRSRLGSGG